jgi:hypothetical protein
MTCWAARCIGWIRCGCGCGCRLSLSLVELNQKGTRWDTRIPGRVSELISE